MAEKKNQHYVPEFYLRLFSDDGNTINLFNIRLGKSILNVGTKDQCSKAYFYGRDLQQEKAFEKLEDVTARTIDSILKTKRLPNKDTKDYGELLFFILSQHCRTKRAGEEYDEVTNKTLKLASRDDPDLSRALEEFKVVADNPTAVPLYVVATQWPLAYDLNAKVIVNRSKELFVTSDNPVVFYNQYMENYHEASCTGVASSGLQIFFPISPDTMLLLYDAGVYRVGSSKDDCCEFYAEAEALKINELQWINALQNVYYSDGVRQDSILAQAKRSLVHRPPDLAIVEEYVDVSDPNRSLIVTRKVDHKIRLRPSFIRIKKSMKKIPLLERDRERSPYLMAARDEFHNEVEAGRYREEEFPKFLRDLKIGRIKEAGLSRE